MKAKFDISENVKARLEYLMKLREKIFMEYEGMAEGDLLVCPGSTKKSFRYYLRKTPQDKRGDYLDKTKEKEKKYYAKKKYYKALIKNIDKEIKNLKLILESGLSDSIIETYKLLNSGVKNLITPINIDDETYIEQWKSQLYEGLDFNENDNTAFYSERGERMRSKSEVLIANALNRAHLQYKYECPVRRKNGDMLYPDFTILDVKGRRNIYWEHLGKMGDISYITKNLWKLEEYKQVNIFLGVNLFITYESGTNALGTREIERTIDCICGNFNVQP